jgi:hypothetical protein
MDELFGFLAAAVSRQDAVFGGYVTRTLPLKRRCFQQSSISFRRCTAGTFGNRVLLKGPWLYNFTKINNPCKSLLRTIPETVRKTFDRSGGDENAQKHHCFHVISIGFN